jgi:hypothetical protein
MKRYMQAILMTIVLIGSSIAAFAGDVRTDYDHSVNFSQYSTYSWGKVQTSNHGSGWLRACNAPNLLTSLQSLAV